MKKRIITKESFSLIELLVTVAIIGIMATLSIVSMNAVREKRAVESAAREVAAVVREAQNYALTGKDLTASSANCSYIFFWTKDSGNYGLQPPPAGCKAANYTLKNGVNFSSDSETISFGVPFSMLSGSTRTITVKKGTNSTYNICVYASGIVKEQLDPC